MMESRFPRTVLWVTAGLLIWAADFIFVYVFAALACARGFADVAVLGFPVVPLVSAVATAVAAAATAALIAVAARNSTMATAGSRDEPAILNSQSAVLFPPPQGEEPEGGGGVFLTRLALIVAILALIAVAMTGLPGLLVAQTCAT